GVSAFVHDWGLVPISSMTLYTRSAMCASSFGILLSVNALASFTCVLTQGVTVSLLIGARETFRNSTSDPSDCSAIRPRSAVASEDRKSTRLNSSHEWISYAVFCLKKK